MAVKASATISIFNVDDGATGATGVGVKAVTAYYAVGTSGTTKPSTPSTTAWSTALPTVSATQFLWLAYLVTYTDGTTAWTEPYCVTDVTTRERVSTLETDFSVVQGQITSKVWQSDIDTAVEDLATAADLENATTTIADNYSTLTQTMDGISTEVGSVQSALTELGDTAAETAIALEETKTALTQTAENLTVAIQQATSNLASAEDVDGLMDTLYKYFQFSDAGLTIGDGASAITLVLDNGVIKFQNAGNTFAYWSGEENMFYTGDIVVEVNQKAQFGNFAFLPREDGSLSFLKVTG